MIVSHRYRFIFLHGQKTAGSSVSLTLLRYLDADDVWLNAPSHGILVDALRHGIVPAPVAHPDVIAHIHDTRGADLADRMQRTPAELTLEEMRAVAAAFHELQPAPPRGPKVLGGWQHVDARSAREQVGHDTWEAYYKFSIERNPWDRLVSLYWWRWRKNPKRQVPFRTFVEAACRGSVDEAKRARARAASNWSIYAIGDELAVQHVADYERLTAELLAIAERLGLPHDGWLPRLKSGTRRQPLTFDAAMSDMVREAFHREIAEFGFTEPELARTHGL